MGVQLVRAANSQREMAFPASGVGGVSLQRSAVSSQSLIASVAASTFGSGAPFNNMSRDGFSWDSSQSIIQDGSGHWIGVVIDNTGPNAKWIWSNDNFATVTASGAIDGGDLTRASIVWDSIHDQVYAFWQGTDVDLNAGMLVRKYAITRTGGAGSNISAIATTRDAALNIQLDYITGAGTYHTDSPQAFFLIDNAGWAHGALLCVWSVGLTGGSVNGGEVRASMCVLANGAADNSVANWTAPAGSSTATISQDPQLTTGHWSKLFGTTSVGSSIGVNGSPFGVCRRLSAGTHANSLYLAYYDASSDKYRLAEFPWRGTPNYDFAGTVVRVDLVPHRTATTTSDGGYNGKQELTSQMSHNTSTNRLYLGVSTWAGDAGSLFGDEWRLVEYDIGTGVVTSVAAYQAALTDCQVTSFVTGSVRYDPTSGLVMVAWTDLVNKYGYVRTFSRTTAAQAAKILGNSAGTGAPFDIPCIISRDIALSRNFNAGAVATPPSTPTYTAPYTAYIYRLTWS